MISQPATGKAQAVLLKIGGSMLTTRREPPAFRHRQAARLAEEIRNAGRPVIVVHGTGRFTKRLVMQEKVAVDWLPEAPRDFAVRFWHASTAVTWQLWRAFVTAGCPAVSLPPTVIFDCHKGKLSCVRMSPLVGCMRRGLVPLIHGGVLLDEAGGYYLCSSDQMMAALAEALHPAMILFASDVDGVYPHCPPQPRDRILPQVDAAAAAVLDPNGCDERMVGGMRNKLSHALACTLFCRRCLIINGLVPGRVQRALAGLPVPGTEVIGNE